MTVVNALPYKILKTISRGPLAEVHEAIGPQGVAVLKVAQAEAGAFGDATTPPNLEQGLAFVTGGVSVVDPDPGEVLVAEARVLLGITHAAFPRVLEQGEALIDGKPRRWVLMEKINGTSWRAAFDTPGKPSPRSVLKLAQLLAEVQASGQLAWHGDLKPENVLIDATGRPRPIDPTSGCVERDGAGLPLNLLLTESYNPLYALSDLPALGMMLLEVLAGGVHPLAAGAEEPPAGRTFGPAIERWLDGRAAIGQLRMARRLACLTLTVGADPAIEAVALRALNLARHGDQLDLAPPYADVAVFAADLARAIG